MTALVLAAWIAATVARLAAALRRLADAVAPLTEEAPRQASAPAPTPTAEQRARFEDINARMVKRYEAAVEANHAELAEAPAPAAVASRATPVGIDPRARRPAPDHAAETAADVADPRALARACLAAEGAAPAPGWPTVPQARAYLASMLPVLPEPLRARVERYRAAPAIKLHYVRSYREALCGAAYPGSRCTGDPQRWHAEPPATRCPTCAAELRRADPHRFDTRLQGITDTSGDADELLSREPPFAGRGGSL